MGGIASKVKLEIERARVRYPAADVGIRTFRRFSEDDGGVLAAALTYYTFFSVFPLLLFAASAVGYLTFLSPEIRESLLDTGLEGVPLLNQILTRDVLDTLQAQRGTLALVGLVMALYSGSGAIVALNHALNRINRIEEEGTFIQKRLASLKWLGILGGAAIVTLAMGGLVQGIGTLLGTGPVVNVLLSLLVLAGSAAVNTGIFATAYKFLSKREQSWKAVLPGAIAAAGAFEVLKLVGGLYLQSGAEGRTETFGAFSTAAGLLVASYLLAQITLLAAELNAVLAERRAMRTNESTT